MRKHILCLSIALCSILSVSQTVRAEMFEYSKHTYQVDAATCDAQAQALAEKISHEVHGAIKSAYCAPMSPEGFDIRVTLDSAVRPEVEVAVHGFRVVMYSGRNNPINKDYSVISDEAVYHKIGDCLASLPQYEAIFIEQTGLTPISSQCNQLTARRYIPQIDAFGASARHFYELSIDLGRGMSSENLQLDLTNYLSALGARSVLAARPASYLLIRYYADHEFEFSSWDFEGKNNFMNLDQCQAALATAQSVFSHHQDLKLTSLRCGKSQWPLSKDTASMVAIMDRANSEGSSFTINLYTKGVFPTYDACKASQQNIGQSFCAADIDIYGEFHGYSLIVLE